MIKLNASCTHDIAHLAFSQEPAHLKKKREQINGKNKTAEIRMDFPPQFSFIDLILDYEKNSNGKNMMKKP